MINDNDEVQWAYLLDPTFELVNTAGKPLTDGYIEVYIHGTRSKYYCASDFDGTLHPFKIPLDSLGANIVLASPAHAYDVYAYNKFGNLVMSRYNVVPATGDGSVIKDVVTITSNDGTVDVTTSDQTNWDLSIKDTVDRIDEHDIVLTELATAIDAINTDLSNKKDKQTSKSFTGSQTKTITSITQNQQGVISVTYEDIDLPPEVPNVEITSPNGTIDVQSSTDVQTNTKTFTIDVNSEDVKYWRGKTSAFTLNRGHSGQDLHAVLSGSGNLTPNNLSAGLYLVTASFDVYPSNVTNELLQFSYIFQQDKGTYEIDCSIPEDSQSNKFSYEHVEISNIINIQSGYPTPTLYFGLNFPTTTNNTLNFTCHNFAIFKLDNYIIAGGGGGGGTEYIAGDAIDITDDTINVKVNPASGIDIVNDELVVKVGQGLSIDPASGLVIINSEVGDVVQTVEKLKQDLDTQLTVNFDMPNIDNVYDFANPSIIGNLSNGAVMLCQAFTVPINHDIRVDDGETENPTLVGIYAKQAFTGKKIMLALYVYDFETGYTDYVGDTGPVSVTQGRNEFPLVHINPNIAELKSSCVYYATLYLPSNAHSNGLYLAGCPSYSNASYINATPRFTVGVENIVNPNTNQEIDMSNATTGRLDFNDGNGNYYIGPWSDNYNERPSIPRFFMQIRNGEAEEPIVVEPFTDIGSYTLKNTDSISTVFGSSVNVNTSTYGAVFMEVTPAQDVDVTGWVCYDNYSIDERQWYGTVFDSAFENKLSEASNGTISELGETSTGSGIYGHEFRRSSALHLTANTTYRFLVGIPHSNNDLLVQYNTPTNEKTLHLFESGYNVSQWVTYSRANNVQGIDFLIKDANHEWRI